MKYPPRVSLGQFPTPIERLERLSRYLGGPDIYVKRDDNTGLATGGNKTRKLEFLLAAAQEQGCDHLVTLGGPQSNHCRQMAAAAARFGMGCSLVLRGDPPPRRLGNLLLDELLGAQVHWSGRLSRESVAEELMTKLRKAGGRPYFVPLGGSTALGSLGYVIGMQEALEQLKAQEIEIDVMVVASSSGGTQAGLALGAALFGYSGQVLGISIDASLADLTACVQGIAQKALGLLGSTSSVKRLAADRLKIDVNADYLGGGYSVVSNLEIDAIHLLARSEGILLDPVYTGRAMGGLIDLIRKDTFDRCHRILFWHTGGAAALSAFSEEISPLNNSAGVVNG